MKKQIVKFINKLPYVRGLVSDLKNYKNINRFPAGHYHSPIPDFDEVESHFKTLNNSILDINFDFENQNNQLETYLPFYSELPWDFKNDDKNQHVRYKNYSSYYRYSDAIFLYSMMRAHRPSKIIEVGSGFSSAIMLDTNDLFFNKSIKFTFIEPNPQDRLDALLTETDRETYAIKAQKVQDVDLKIFDQLEENDFLFVDSSHLSKTGSDLNYILFEILPRLKKGVIIHFHDVFFPFEYPKNWIIEEKFYWNECYILRSFLMNNKDYSIEFFNSAAHKFQYNYLFEKMPDVLIDHNNCGAIWLKKN